MGAHSHARRLFDPEWSRAFWLDRCEGFHVEGPRGRVGVVEDVGRGGDGLPTSLLVRCGLLRRRVREVPVDEVAELDPRDLLIVLRQPRKETVAEPGIETGGGVHSVRAMTVRAAADLIQPGLLGEAVDSGPALVFVADDDGRYVAVNRRACELLGYEREELLGLRVTDIATDAEAPDLYSALRRAGSAAGSTHLRAKDGTLHSFTYRATETTTAGMPFWVSVGFVD